MASRPTSNVPRQLACALSGELMVDPVTDREGFTYDRAAVLAWLAAHTTSPVTGHALSAADLQPNRALKETVDEWFWLYAAPAVVTAPVESSTASMSLCVTPDSGDGTATMMVTLTPPPRAPVGSGRLPCDLVCVIDVSGSMGDEAVAKDGAGKEEHTGLTVLDVVKHAVLTIAELLGPEDRLSLVPFSDNAKAGKYHRMNDKGKAAMKAELTGFAPSGCTNLWSGIVEGVKVAKTSKRNSSVFVLTDGIPTYTPDGGYVAAMKDHLRTLGEVPFTVSTFGFGYSLDSGMLDGVAQEGRGTFSFIPDSGLVGTVFVNAAANLLTTYATAARVTVAVPPELQPMAPLDTGVEFKDGHLIVDLGTVQFGQARHFVATLRSTRSSKSLTSAPATRKPVALATGKAKVTRPVAAVEPAFEAVARLRVDGAHLQLTATASREPSPWLPVERARQAFVGGVAALANASSTDGHISALVATIEAFRGQSQRDAAINALFDGLLADLRGEIELGAGDNALFQRWGRHYFRSIAAANNREQCNNFKDKSVQCFGGALFANLQSDGERAFLALPSPVGTFGRSRYGYGSACATGSAPAPQPVNMAWAYNCSGGCIAPTALVTLASGAEKPACEVRKGDVLAGGAAVDCVVRVSVPRGKMDFVRLHGGLLVSPYHPVRIGGEWHFPCEAPTIEASRVSVVTDRMYSFVLASAPADGGSAPATMAAVRSHGVDVAPIAHECGDGVPVIGHAFFGSGASLAALKASPNFTTGSVDVLGFVRDPMSKRIVGMTVA